MKRLSQILFAAGVAAALTTGSLLAQDANNNNQGGRRNRDGQGQGQGPGNFDPEQMRQRMMERYREQLAVKDDAEWKIIEERITKINDARREVGFRGMGFGGRGGGGGGQGGQGGQAGGGGRRGFGGEPSPEAQALQAAVDANASSDDIKAKLAKYRASVKEKEAKLETAQDDLRKVLTVKQEASAVLLGLLK